jgi:NAD(P)H-dependent flavin oxidoreductase YrpB (nitropropane dioxygenase family)
MKTKLTELLSIETPIICGGMMRVGTADLSAAASNAGALGVMTALTLPTPELLKQRIIEKDETQTSLIFRSFCNSARVYKNCIARKVVEIEKDGGDEKNNK